MPLPDAYVALRSVLPVSSSSRGEPETATVSVNVTLTRIVSPGLYVPVRFGDETDSIRGGRPSTARPVMQWPSSRASDAGWPSSTATTELPLRARADRPAQPRLGE